MIRLLRLLFLAICLEAGCAERPPSPERGVRVGVDKKSAENPLQKGDQNPVKTPEIEAWVYKTNQGFQFALPKGWKQKPGKDEFYRPGPSPMLCSVKLVRKESAKEHRKTAQDYWRFLKESPDQLTAPKREEGKTKSGNPVSFMVFYEKGKKNDTFYYVASSHTWIKQKELTVQILFEGQGKMRSRAFRSWEHSAFETAARTICLSVDEIRPE